MIIYNTTFHADNAVVGRFIDWIKSEYVPAALKGGVLSEPRLTLVLSGDDEQGRSYSLQFRAESLDELRRWYDETGDTLVSAMASLFGEKVAGFSTLLEEVEL